MTHVRAKIDQHIQRKKGPEGAKTHDKSVNRFFDAIISNIDVIDFQKVKCVIIASPGFVREQFNQYFIKWAQEAGRKDIIDNRTKIVLIHSSTGFKQDLQEILSNPNYATLLAETKASSEIKALDDFYDVLRTNPAKAFYGFNHVQAANDRQGIDVLLVSDRLFRSPVIEERQKYVNLVETAQDNGAQVKIFSSLHPSGEKLDNLTGIAAILRYPMPDLEEEDFDDYDDDSASGFVVSSMSSSGQGASSTSVNNNNSNDDLGLIGATGDQATAFYVNNHF